MDEHKRRVTQMVAGQILFYRRKRGLSQEEVALRANLNPAYFGQVERGVKCPTVDTIYRIAAALDIAPSSLIITDSTYQHEMKLDARLTKVLEKVPKDKTDGLLRLLEDLLDIL